MTKNLSEKNSYDFMSTKTVLCLVINKNKKCNFMTYVKNERTYILNKRIIRFKHALMIDTKYRMGK